MSQVKGIVFCRETAKSSWGIPFMHLQVTVVDLGQFPPSPPPPLIFRPNWGPKGWKKVFLSPSLPSTPPPPYPRYPFSLILRDSIDSIDNYQLSFGRVPLIYKLYIYKVYLLLTDAKLLMTHEGFHLHVIHKYTVPPSEGYQTHF